MDDFSRRGMGMILLVVVSGCAVRQERPPTSSSMPAASVSKAQRDYPEVQSVVIEELTPRSFAYIDTYTYPPGTTQPATHEHTVTIWARRMASAQGEYRQDVFYSILRKDDDGKPFTYLSEDGARLLAEVLERFASLGEANRSLGVAGFAAQIENHEFSFDPQQPSRLRIAEDQEVDLANFRSALDRAIADIDAIKRLPPLLPKRN